MHTNIQLMHIGQVIREIREARNATLEEVAFAADTNASNLSRIERGTQGYSPETLESIASALGVTVSELHLRAETATDTAGKTAGRKRQLQPATLAASKYSKLTPEHRELADEFMALLLRRQRPSKP
ncbi:helix-turn-helix transcriptional regulator [Sulfuritalea sp.]|uniref:helix-turn-helix domain-containing protein n=1 Tax=Sulfuritalea sp. TaxID=2480090 RepID=UPI001ACAB0B8|nr:helix-turn-helix transcriptional regulator [Sulfuritalea sp.]MBN8476056.1 helix-turn-helix transcriptional regulator [Sulfuritalea sp.]